MPDRRLDIGPLIQELHSVEAEEIFIEIGNPAEGHVSYSVNYLGLLHLR